MRKWKWLIYSLLVGMLTFPLVACETEGPMEETGEEMGEAMDETVEETQEGFEEAGEAMEPESPAE